MPLLTSPKGQSKTQCLSVIGDRTSDVLNISKIALMSLKRP